MMISSFVQAVSVLLGGLSLLGFFAVLLVGPFELVPLGLEPKAALAWDAALCLVFFAQHSVMVRRTFRSWSGRSVPPHYHPAVYSIASGVVLLLLVGLWQHTQVVLFSAEGPARWALRGAFGAAMALFVWSVKALGPFDLFGLRPIREHRRGRASPDLPLAVRGPYRFVRHPLYGLFIVLAWTSPDVSTDRLLFNVLFTGWLLIGTVLEERDLLAQIGDPYREYQRTVPMLVPWRGPADPKTGGVR